MSTLQQKVSISAGSALLFFLLNLPATYRLTNYILPCNTVNPLTGCPTTTGLIIHASIFFVITFLSMTSASFNAGIKFKNSLYATVIFLLIASPFMYSLTGSIFGESIATSKGCPTLLGVLIHSIVYGASLVGIMYLPL